MRCCMHGQAPRPVMHHAAAKEVLRPPMVVAPRAGRGLRPVQRLRAPQHRRTRQYAAADVSGAAAWQLPSRSWTTVLPRSTQYDAEMLQLAIPALAAMLLDPIMSMVTAAMLGHLGTQQLGAVSLANLAVSFAIYMFSFLVFLTTPRIAAAHVVGDKQQVSRLAGVGLWLAGGCGTVTTLAVMLLAGPIVAALRPAEAAVAQFAVEYMRVRSLGILASMLGFVAAATYRGVKDTRTPLVAAVGAMITNLVLTPLFLYVFDWGVVGAASAGAIAQWTSAGILLALLVKRDLLQLPDLWQRPALEEVMPYMGQALVLAFRIVVTFGMVIYASAVCVRAGAASQAGFEIIRQVWVLSIQLFECLNVAAQSMCAAYLGSGDRAQAQAVLWRAMQLSTGAGLLMGACMCAAQGPIVNLFTSDAAVAVAAGAVMPMIALMLPMDAGASILDGGLIAAGQTNILSVIQVGGSLAQHAALTWVVSQGAVSVFSVWAVLKMLTVVRLVGGYYVNFQSPWSAYMRSNSSSSGASSTSSKGSHVDNTSGADSAAASDSAAEELSSSPTTNNIVAATTISSAPSASSSSSSSAPSNSAGGTAAA